jgi:hypothetical protein
MSASPARAAISRAASMPPMPGIFTSSSTMSGSNAAASSTARSPLAASPANAKPGAAAITALAARRKGAWSSTTSTLNIGIHR